MLTPLQDWMMGVSHAVFEARSEDEYLHALNAAFSPDLILFANGERAGFARFKEMSQTVVAGSDFRCTVEWKAAVEVPTDPSNPNRGGMVGGHYIITNVREPGQTEVLIRHKFINALIESQSDDPNVDSRRVVFMSGAVVNKPE